MRMMIVIMIMLTQSKPTDRPLPLLDKVKYKKINSR